MKNKILSLTASLLLLTMLTLPTAVFPLLFLLVFVMLIVSELAKGRAKKKQAAIRTNWTTP